MLENAIETIQGQARATALQLSAELKALTKKTPAAGKMPTTGVPIESALSPYGLPGQIVFVTQLSSSSAGSA